MKNNQIYDLTLASIFAGIILVMALIPQIGFVTLMPGVSVVLVHIPVLIGVFLLPKRYGILLGFFFGIGSLLAAIFYAQSPIDLAFRNPLISVVPRVLFGLVAYYIFVGLKKIEGTFKLGKTFIFGIVAFVSIFAIYFGTQAVTRSFSFAEYTQASGTYQTLVFERDTNEDLTPAELAEIEADIATLEADLPVLFDEAETRLSNVSSVTIPISLIVIVLFLTTYYHFIIKNKKEEILYPSAFIIATVSHTILVLAALIIVRPALFGDALGFQSAITIIYTIAAANGLIEALVAVFVGTPIILAIKQIQKQSA